MNFIFLLISSLFADLDIFGGCGKGGLAAEKYSGRSAMLSDL
jgi:hypothetical protein